MMETSRLSPGLLGLVVLVHMAVVGFLATLRVTPVSRSTPALMVDFIASVPEPKSSPEIVPPRPRPVARQERPRLPPAPTRPVLAAESSAPDVAAPVETAREPRPVPPTEVVAPPAPPALVAPPRFDADYLDNPKPVYPLLSRRMREQGKVVLRVFVESSGLPGRVEIRTSSGSERLDGAAMAAVARWKFIPARQGAEAVGAWVLVPIDFTLKE